MTSQPKSLPTRSGGLHISTETAVRGSGRPPMPPPDPRLEAAKTWSDPARAAAKKAFSKAASSGASRDEAIDAGHRAGLRRQAAEERRLAEAKKTLAGEVEALFGARIVKVLPPARDPTADEERCFERLFPDRGYPEPATEPATPERSVDSDDEDQKTTPPEGPRAALADELARSPRQATLGFDREARSA